MEGWEPALRDSPDAKMSTAFDELKNWIKRHSAGKT
jgi:hypothetical protein